MFIWKYVIKPEPKMFFWIAASAVEAAAVNPKGTKTLLANGVCTFFINGKPAVINGLRKLRNPTSWLFMITFMIYFIWLFVSLSLEPFNNYKGSTLILLLTRLYLASKIQFGMLLPLLILSIMPGTSNAILVAGLSLSISSSRIPRDCIVLYSWTCDNFVLPDESFAKALGVLETWILVNSNLWGKLVSLLESSNTLDERCKATSVPFFIPDINLFSCELENFTFKVFYLVIWYWCYIELK